jgi:hypothetical protein
MDYQISVDLAPLLNAAGALTQQLMPLVSQAVHAVAEAAQQQWIEGVKQASLWSGEKKPYIESITMQMTGPFSAEISSDYALAFEIENGRPAKDLKAMLQTSSKVRTTKDGRRFMVIPFRHNTPGNDAHAKAMPPAIYELASAMEKSSVVGQSQRPAGEVTEISPTFGMIPAKNQSGNAWTAGGKPPLMVPRHHYAWGDRLPAGLAPKLSPKHSHDPYAGMVRMETSSGGQKSSAYMTFRVMMEGSPKWIVPERPGLKIVEGVANTMQPVAEAALAEAVKRTFQAD